MVLSSSSGMEYFELCGVLQVVRGSMCSCTEDYEVVSPRNSSLCLSRLDQVVTITRCTDWY